MRLGKRIGEGRDFEAVETAAKRLALRIMGQALAGRLNAAIETVASRDTDSEPSPFARRAVREALRRSFLHAPRQVVLGDGAPWIWNWADEHLPNAIQIVNVFHAKGHLVQVANAIYGAATDLALSWGKQRRDDLDQGRIDRLLAALHDHAHTCDEARKCIDSFTRNRQRIRYPAFRAMGLCVSTGVVEAACKNIVGTRLKRGGMHWSLNGANAILALRCAILSNRFLDFWERRACAKSSCSQICRAPPFAHSLQNLRADYRIALFWRHIVLTFTTWSTKLQGKTSKHIAHLGVSQGTSTTCRLRKEAAHGAEKNND